MSKLRQICTDCGRTFDESDKKTHFCFEHGWFCSYDCYCDFRDSELWDNDAWDDSLDDKD